MAAITIFLRPLGIHSPPPDRSGTAGRYYVWLQIPVEVGVTRVAAEEYNSLLHPRKIFLTLRYMHAETALQHLSHHPFTEHLHGGRWLYSGCQDVESWKAPNAGLQIDQSPGCGSHGPEGISEPANSYLLERRRQKTRRSWHYTNAQTLSGQICNKNNNSNLNLVSRLVRCQQPSPLRHKVSRTPPDPVIVVSAATDTLTNSIPSALETAS